MMIINMVVFIISLNKLYCTYLAVIYNLLYEAQQAGQSILCVVQTEDYYSGSPHPRPRPR